jgi:AAA+ superfamily predicted ATPase
MELRTDRYKLKDIIYGNKEKGLIALKELKTTAASKFVESAHKISQKYHKRYEDIEFIRKGITIDPEDIEISEGERAAVRLITTPRLDRDNEILIPSGAILEDFQDNPVSLYAHDYTGLPIGSDRWIKKVKEGLLAKTFYARHQFADDVYNCVKDKHLRASSVGFIPLESATPEDREKFEQLQELLLKDYAVSKDESGKAKNIYSSWILLEHSDVPVPSNQYALNLAVGKNLLKIQSKRLIKDLEIEVVKDDREIEIEIQEVACGKCGKKFDYSKEPEVSMGWVKCPNCGAIIDQEGNVSSKEDKEIEVEIETKPETTENYIRIPVSEGHDGHRIRTITISAEKGIKALYCGECKVIITYLFDVDKFTMAEAQAWVQEHKSVKEFWNPKFAKLFDPAQIDSPKPLRFNYMLFEKFLECKVKQIFQNNFSIPCPLIGTYLSGMKSILSEFKLMDTRHFEYGDDEIPPMYEVIQLDSKSYDDFLLMGMQFYDAKGVPLVATFCPDWGGERISLVTSLKNKVWNKELMGRIHKWATDNNFLKNEKFSLSGEFLQKTDDDWDNLILNESQKKTLHSISNFMDKEKEKMASRGFLLIGQPGTGKTKTGRVMMNDLNSTFIWVSSRDFRIIGPLNALVLAFEMARDLAPTVLFIEDVDTWLSDYYGDTVMTDLIKTEMDGIRQNKGILTFMTSNFPEKLPEALLDRPGRFHDIIKYELPGKVERQKMIELWIEGIDSELSEIMPKILEQTEGFSGAHMKELVDFAFIIASEEEIGIGKAILLSLEKIISQRELINEIKENKTNAKAFWAKVKSFDFTKDKTIEIESPSDKLETVFKLGDTEEWKKAFAELKKQIESLKSEKVLGNKERQTVRAAIEALNNVLELDEGGSEEEPKRQSLEIEFEKDGGPDLDHIEKKIDEVVEKALNAEKLKSAISEGIRLGIAKLQGKVL